MSRQHRVPMSPEDLPQQRLAPVVSRPLKSSSLAVHVVFLRVSGLEGLPTEPDSEVEFQASVEWAWSPMHNRQDHYYLSRSEGNFYLWNFYGYPDPCVSLFEEDNEQLVAAVALRCCGPVSARGNYSPVKGVLRRRAKQ